MSYDFEGVPYSPDLEPAGPDPSEQYTSRPQRVSQSSTSTPRPVYDPPSLSQDTYGDLYAGLPDAGISGHKGGTR